MGYLKCSTLFRFELFAYGFVCVCLPLSHFSFSSACSVPLLLALALFLSAFLLLDQLSPAPFLFSLRSSSPSRSPYASLVPRLFARLIFFPIRSDPLSSAPFHPFLLQFVLLHFCSPCSGPLCFVPLLLCFCSPLSSLVLVSAPFLLVLPYLFLCVNRHLRCS